MIRELTVAEYMELVQGEGLLVKSMAGQVMSTDSVGSEPDEEEEEEEDGGTVPEEDDEEDEDPKDPEEPTEFVLTISTNEPDRINDVLNPMGCVTDNFAQNPLFLYEHGNTGNGPLTDPDAVLGRAKSITMDPETKSVRANVKYFPREGNKLVSKILDMERKGLIPGNSIGWRPIAGIRLDDVTGRRTVDQWELLEISKVLVPVNGKATNKRISA